MEEEDRLELRVRGAKQPQAPLLRAGMRALVRQDDPRLVGLEPKRRDDAGTCPGDAVRPDEVLCKRPERRLVVLDEHALRPPVSEREPRLLLRVRQSQVHDVVRVEGEVALALLGRDHVVGGRDDALARLGVAKGAERLHDGHSGRA